MQVENFNSAILFSFSFSLLPAISDSSYVLTVYFQMKKPTDLDLHCLPLSMWIYSKIQIKKSDWLKIRNGRGILIYSAGQGLIYVYNSVNACWPMHQGMLNMAVPCCVVARDLVSLKPSIWLVCIFYVNIYMFCNSEGLKEDYLLYAKCSYPL